MDTGKFIAKSPMKFFFVLLILSLFIREAYPQEDRSLYYQGLRAARAGETEAAFLRFYRITNLFPESKFLENSLFAAGEYYSLVGDSYDAARMFIRFIKDYPESNARIFALAYLLKIAAKQGQDDTVKSLGKEIVILNRVSLLFRDFKEYEYVSPLYMEYKVIYFIDKVKFYLDGKLFTEISY